MVYERKIEFEGNTGTMQEIIQVLEDVPQNYHCYIRNVDSIYPVTELNDDALGEDEFSFSSIETYGKNILNQMMVSELLEVIKGYKERNSEQFGGIAVYAEKAENIDTSLDLQLETPRGLTAAIVDDICKMVLFVTGNEYEYC